MGRSGMATDTHRICVVIGRTRHKMVAIEIQEATKRGASFLELRLDFIAKAPDLKRMLAVKPCRMMATVRRPQDGGRWGGSEDARKMLLKQCIVGGFDWVDLETDIADEIRRFKDVKRVVSYHNLNDFPEDLEDIYERMSKQDADVLKIVVSARSLADNIRVLNLYQNATKPTVAFCSGEIGFPSRLLSLKYGAPFTYAAFNKERGVAPGMPSFDELLRTYPTDSIDVATRIYGVVGDPVAHSMSPLVHNAAFRKHGINALYLPFRVPRGQLSAFLETYSEIPVDGYSVTIPHKEAAAAASHTRNPTVETTHAANTLIRRPHGFHAENTDYQAALDALKHHLMKGPSRQATDLHKRMVLILGAGGAARAIAHALHREGAIVHIANRTVERAEKLADEIGGESLDWNARHKEGCDIVFNCTPVGMHPNVDESPIHASYLRPDMIVFDTVYTPETTMLIREARNRGAQTVTGVEMFVRQAGLQFHHFTGLEPPLDLMSQVLRRAISPVTIKEDDV
ncbi:MAG: shikimate dehydrogenase [Gemmataceae bacterium]